VSCIPSKALLHAAKVIEEAKHAEVFGMSFGKLSIDIAKLRGWKDAVVKKQTGGLGLLAKSRKVEFIQGRASIVDARTLSVETSGGERRVETDYIIIATGSRPAAVPGVSIDSPRVLDSTTALDLPDVPKRLLVVGGGYIGLELGTVYAALGSKVSVVEMTDGLLPGADRDLAAMVANGWRPPPRRFCSRRKSRASRKTRTASPSRSREGTRLMTHRRSIACSLPWAGSRIR
jgi:dihydrolipoamide dehydrogenase